MFNIFNENYFNVERSFKVNLKIARRKGRRRGGEGEEEGEKLTIDKICRFIL